MRMRFGGANHLLRGLAGKFDGHAHVFRADLPMIAGRRYTPGNDAPFGAFSELLRDHGLDGALLIQPSFLGTDNSYLLEQLSAANATPDLVFRGVAALDPKTSMNEITDLSSAGIAGIRLNLVGGGARNFDMEPFDELLRNIDSAGWHVELHCEGPLLPPLLEALLRRCETVVVDHFGLPDRDAPIECKGLSAILAAPVGRVYVKASAPYRVFSSSTRQASAEACQPIVDLLIDGIGPDRLIWGSDWPWTRFEGQHSYSDSLAWFQVAGDCKASAAL